MLLISTRHLIITSPHLHGDEAIALRAEILHLSGVCSSALNWTCPALSSPWILTHLRAALNILGLHLLRVVFPHKQLTSFLKNETDDKK